jgi:hypothetical protein
MPAGARFGDVCTGHDGFKPRTCDAGSPDTFINGFAANRVGDHWIEHCDHSGSCHDSVLKTGSTTVFINGIPVGRVGDLIECGSAIAQGSSDTFFG